MTVHYARPVQRNASLLSAMPSPQAQSLTHVIQQPEVNTRRLSGLRVHMPAAHRARPHMHARSELIVHVLDGNVDTLWGGDMQRMPHDAGQMVYVPASVPHAGHNPSTTRSCLLTEIRTDKYGNADTQMLSHLDELVRTSMPDPDTPDQRLIRGEVRDGEPRPIAVPLPLEPGDGPQGPLYRTVLDRTTAPVQALSAGWIGIPAGEAIDGVWVHPHTERILYVASGHVAMLWGPEMEQLRMSSGAFCHSPVNVPYTLINLSRTEPAVITEYRDRPVFCDDTYRATNLDHLVAPRINPLRDRHEAAMATHQDVNTQPH